VNKYNLASDRSKFTENVCCSSVITSGMLWRHQYCCSFVDPGDARCVCISSRSLGWC